MGTIGSKFFGAALIATGLAAPACAQTPYYEGKTVRIVVGFTPGGGYDSYARLLARHLGAHIPGKPNVVVENMPGAGSLTSVRWLDGPAPKDGTAIVAFNPGLITQTILEPEKLAKVNFLDFAWVANIARDQRVCYVWHTRNVKTFEEFRARKGWNFGTTAVGAANWVNQRTLQRIFNVDMKIIAGFPGSAEQRIAIERGELDGDCGSWTSIAEEWVANNRIVPVIKFSIDLPKDAPANVPYANDLAKSDEERAALDVINGSSEIGRPYLASRQVPAAVMAILRKGFNDAMADRNFIADAERAKLPVDMMSGEDVERALRRIYAAPDAAIRRARAVVAD